MQKNLQKLLLVHSLIFTGIILISLLVIAFPGKIESAAAAWFFHQLLPALFCLESLAWAPHTAHTFCRLPFWKKLTADLCFFAAYSLAVLAASFLLIHLRDDLIYFAFQQAWHNACLVFLSCLSLSFLIWSWKLIRILAKTLKKHHADFSNDF